MPSEEIQRHWAWFSGEDGMRRGARISRAIRQGYEEFSGRDLADATVLDYGAGWGRLTRMLYQFVPEQQVFACDPDRNAVAIFNSLGFARPCDLISATPRTLPYRPGQFDLVFVWSVLTHLPPAMADTVMRALRPIVAPDGLLLITIRPAIFWQRNPLVGGTPEEATLVEQHVGEGIAHLPSGPTWGDTSMSLDYIARRWPEWRTVDTRDPDSDQVEVWLRPV